MGEIMRYGGRKWGMQEVQKMGKKGPQNIPKSGIKGGKQGMQEMS